MAKTSCPSINVMEEVKKIYPYAKPEKQTDTFSRRDFWVIRTGTLNGIHQIGIGSSIETAWVNAQKNIINQK